MNSIPEIEEQVGTATRAAQLAVKRCIEIMDYPGVSVNHVRYITTVLPLLSAAHGALRAASMAEQRE